MAPEKRVKILRETKPNTWIAFSADESRVVGRGDTYAEAVAETENKGRKIPSFSRPLTIGHHLLPASCPL